MRSSRASRASCRAQVADTDVTDATSFNLCAEINQASLDWALDAAGADARARYDAIGEKLVRSSVVSLFTVARETRDLPPPPLPPTSSRVLPTLSLASLIWTAAIFTARL